MDWDGHVAIIWDEGPYEWTYHFGTDDVDEELTIEVQEFQTWRRGPAPPGHHAQRGVRRAVACRSTPSSSLSAWSRPSRRLASAQRSLFFGLGM